MFVGFGLFSVFTLLYHFFMIRALSPIDYGHLNTLTAFFMLITAPANTVQTTIARFVTSSQAKSQYFQARGFLRHFLLLMVTIASSVFILIALGSSFLSSFFQITSRGLIIVTGIVLFFAFVTPVSSGGLQGLQKFGSLAFTFFMNGGLKLILGILFVLLGWGLLGAMGAVALAYFVTAFFSFSLLYFSLKTPWEKVYEKEDLIGNSPPNLFEAYQYVFPVGLTLLCFMVLTNVDLILVKHFFTPIEAGYYSIAQMVGKIILVLPIPMVTVMFPSLFSSEGQEKKTRSILERNLKIAGILCGGGTLCSFIFPSAIIKILSGKIYSECLPLVGMFSVNMAFFSLTLILLYYHLFTSRREFLYPLLLFTLMEVGLILLFHDTLVQVLTVVGIVAFCLALINFYLIYRSYPGKGKELV